MKSLNGANIADYVKANQLHTVQALRSNRIHPKLVIIRDSNNPVIIKYVELKKSYGADIGVEVEDWFRQDLADAIAEANADPSVHGVIVQLPVISDAPLDEILSKIDPTKDVDGLATEILISREKTPVRNNFKENPPHEYSPQGYFESATATAINWLLASYDIDLENAKIALVGRGRLIGKPLERMFRGSGYDVTVFHRGSDLSELNKFDIIISATGVPRLITSDMVRPGAVVVDAGTANESGVLVGDVDESVRARTDLAAITPRIGGVGPLTVTTLFEHVLIAAKNSLV